MRIQESIAIIGTGPAALMIADVISRSHHRVCIFEKRKGIGRKLLIAGSSGLNITNDLPLSEFASHYTQGPPAKNSGLNWERILKDFSPQDWINFLENQGIATFKGTSGRYFVKDMKASGLLKNWRDQLEQRKVEFYLDHECVAFDHSRDSTILTFQSGQKTSFDIVCFGLGGGSYEPKEEPLRWPNLFTRNEICFVPFTPSNVGFQVHWKPNFLKEAEGKPLKNVQLSSSKGRRRGEIIITAYGIEGTPVYFAGHEGTVTIDLKPDLSLQQLISKCASIRENLAPLRRAKKQLNLSEAALALLFHEAPPQALDRIDSLCGLIKAFPLNLVGRQPLTEAISAAGGISLDEITQDFMLKRYPGIFVGGEMLNWDAPTGGFLIQGCISQGFTIGKSVLHYIQQKTPNF